MDPGDDVLPRLTLGAGPGHLVDDRPCVCVLAGEHIGMSPPCPVACGVQQGVVGPVSVRGIKWPGRHQQHDVRVLTFCFVKVGVPRNTQQGADIRVTP